MSFELDQAQHLEAELRKILRRQLRKTERALSGAGKASEQVIHEARTSVKKVRAIVALLEQAGAKVPRKNRKRLKSAAHALSRLRDSAAVIDSLDRVRGHNPKQLSEQTYRLLRRALVADRRRREAQAQRDDAIASASRKLARTRRSAKTWVLPSIDMSDLAEVIGESYRESRRAMKRARETRQSATVHRWRKAVKTLWYQVRLARLVIPCAAPLISELKRLERELGDDHNLVILVATLRGCGELRSMGGEVRQVERLAGRTRRSLRRQAFKLGLRLHARKPRAFTRWIRSSTMKRRSRGAA